MFHAGFSPFSGGFAGVDVFFVISGYLITSIIVDDLERGRLGLALSAARATAKGLASAAATRGMP